MPRKIKNKNNQIKTEVPLKHFFKHAFCKATITNTDTGQTQTIQIPAESIFKDMVNVTYTPFKRMS